MDARKRAEEFLHKKFLEMSSPAGYQPTEEDWQKSMNDINQRVEIERVIDWLLEFANSHVGANTILDSICKEAKDQDKNDRSFGASVRKILGHVI